MNIGKNIKILRQQNNITQETLAEYLGISYQAVSKWENDTNTPDIALLPVIAEYFHISLDNLFSDNISAITEIAEIFKEIHDDDIIRVVQLQGKKILRTDKTEQGKSNPIELIFPINNINGDDTSFKVEIWGDVSVTGDINGDIVCKGDISCVDINGDVDCKGDIYCTDINGDVVCNQNIYCTDIYGDVACKVGIYCNDIYGDVACEGNIKNQ